jgi:ADP-heptose:LPS heptosyltransferase
VHLIKRDNATIVQQGLTDEEAQLLGANNLKPIHLGSFQDTRKLLNTLAGVVTVDTSVAHLAGAMGIRTVVVLPHNSDWRWHDDQYLSSWYNTIYLVRREQTDRTGALAFERALMLLQELVQSKQA